MPSKKITAALARAEAALILPSPYKLFSRKLLSPEIPSLENRPTGFQLFEKVVDYKAPSTTKTVWRELNTEQKKAFEHPAADTLRHYTRIKRGYQAISSSIDAFNPFYETQLYPWEIIKDKLRHKPIFAADIYDQLINEALKPKIRNLSPENLYYSDIVFHELQAEATEFPHLPVATKAAYETLAQKKKRFYQKLHDYNKSKKRQMTAWDEHVRQHYAKATGSPAERNRLLSQLWRQQARPNIHLPNKTRVFRERSLDISTSIVMDYIFKVGSVDGFRGDWRQWKASVMGNAHYFHQALFPYILQRTGNHVTFVSDYASYDHLGTWDSE